MAIVRNKKPQPVDPSAIAAFGAQADAKTEANDTQPASREAGRKKQDAGKPPASSLIRWEGHEELRDAIIAYAKAERYPVHTVLLDSLRRGFDQLRNDRNQR